ncbi:hypothetical protein F4782DRAFT_280290 [Xylaria castorea]|nr:hypothetical protein F4782DRAFT_280290 [Xylaria castorea]
MDLSTEADEMNCPSFLGKTPETISCIFPRLTHGPDTNQPSKGQVQRQHVTFSIPRDNLSDLAEVHLAAWAILLSCYIGTDRVCFRMIEESTTSSTGNTSIVNGSSLCYSLCKFSLPSGRKVSDLVLDCRKSLDACSLRVSSPAAGRPNQTGVQGKPRLNTAVFFVDHDLTQSASKLAGSATLGLEDIELSLVVPKSRTSHVDSCFMQFSPSLLSDAAAAFVAANYQTILTDLVSRPKSTLSQLRKISSEDLARMWSWNQTCPDSADGLVHDFVRHNLSSRPDAPAVYASDVSLTYRELDALSNVLANFLVQNGVGPETVVPLCFDKSAWATVSMLATAKSGGAFTLIDPSYPMRKLQDILQQVDAKFLLCSASSLAIWEGHLPAYEVSARTLEELPRLSDAPNTLVASSNLFCVAFTSGSSGESKGVCIEHSNYLSSALHFARLTRMDSSSRVLQFAPYSFDASIFENFTTLICGGCVCVPNNRSRGRDITHILNDFRVNWAFFTPSQVRSINPETAHGLQTLLLMGEAPSRADVEAWTGRVQLINGYGPTECSIVSAIHPSLGTCIDAENIGWPVGGCLWVADMNDYDQLVPIGAVGELVIEGPHLARGYLNDPKKTAEAFINSPKWTADFPASRNRRVYLTGDIVRRNIDGSIVYIKRKDTQAQLRGVQIELGAIEKYLLSDGLVRLCSALIPADGPCKDRLVAVVSVASVNSTYPDGELRMASNSGPLQEKTRQCIRDIQGRLGEKALRHMIPSTWFVLETFPLTSSGKTDRGEMKNWIEGMTVKSLADSEYVLDYELPTAEGATSLPQRSPESTVELLRRAISLVLNLPLERVVPWRSFIGLGGDSISAMQLMSQCREQKIVAKVQDILRCKSVSELASLVEVDQSKTSTPQAEVSHGVPFGLSPIQQLYFQWEPEGTLSGGENRFNQSFLLRVKQPIESESLQAALTTLVARHPILRGRFVKSPSWQQVIPADADGPCRFREHYIYKSYELQNIILKSQCEIDVSHGPVFVVDLVHSSDGQVLSMIAHHAVIDLVSWRILMRELEHLLQGETLPYQRSVSWQVWHKLQADYASRHLPPRIALPHYIHDIAIPDLKYWGMENKRNLFKDTIRADIQLDSATTSRLLSTEYHQALRAEPVDLFLSAVVNSLARVFRDRKVPTIFRESHGREPWDDSIDISSTVGWFTTMYPIQVELPEGGDLFDTIRHVKDAQRRVPKNGWPYFASRFNHPDGIREFQSRPNVEITFDFLGLYQQLERKEGLFKQESWDNLDVGPEFNRPALCEITAEIIQGRLQMKFEYNKYMNHQSGINRWVKECENELIRVASGLNGKMYALSDFPLLGMVYDGLDNLLTSILPQLGVALDNVEDAYNTSPMQTGLLLSQTKDPALYQCSWVFRIDTKSPFESVDTQRLVNAWHDLAQRHSSLRTIFVPGVSNGNTFVQIVLKKVETRTSRIRCSFDELDGILKGQADIPLQDALPPHKLTICNTGTRGTYMRIDINHISIDGASVHILIRDFLALYDGSQELPKAPSYCDFISQMQTYDQEKGMQYWTSCLDGVEPCHLPVLDDGVGQDGSFQIVRIRSPEAIHHLTQVCQSCNITLPTLFKVAWGLVLGAYTGSDKVCFGYLVSGRDGMNANDKENAVGAFINIMTCYANLTGSLKAVLSKVQEDSLNDLQHQYCSLVQIQRRASSSNLGDQQPLFNTVVNFQVHPSQTANEFSSISLSSEYTYDPTEFSCVIDIAVTGEHLEISLTHRTTLVSPGQAQNIAGAFTTALEGILRSPMAMPAKKLSLMGENSNHQIWGWNSAVPARVDMYIHDIVSRHAATNPVAPVVESWDGNFSYRQLEETTTQLAQHLTHLGIGAGCIVPLFFERSAWTIVAMIAVMKAGGAFVLLDPNRTFDERTSNIIKDTQAKVAVTSEKEYASLVALAPHLIAVIANTNHIEAFKSCPDCHYGEQEISKNLKPRSTNPRDPAYIIFTSATTGKAKGSVISHAAFLTAAAAYGKILGLSPSSRVLQANSYTFDACLFEMLAVLSFGGYVCVPTEQNRTDDLTGAINVAQANLMILTPSVARLIAPTQVPTLKTLILGGETMSKADVARWKGHVRLINGYGSSECPILCTISDALIDDPVNIGRPTGSLCWIVHPDDHELLLPIGATGELIIESFALANGYFDEDARTAEAFIKSPKWLGGRCTEDNQAPNRVYKTGDLVRYNSDGSIRFIGRKDRQLKISGQRINYGEIEQHLLFRCCFMEAVVVEVIEPEACQSRQTLVAFFKFATATNEKIHQNTVILEDHRSSDVFLELSDNVVNHLQTIKASLEEVLPPYMIPSTFIPLRTFPLATSGKLNRQALRESAAKLLAGKFDQYSLLAYTGEARMLINGIENRLREAWAETLGAPLERIASDTNFFHLGGDSLDAMRLVLITRKSYNVALTVADIFKHPRLHDMATVAQDHGSENDATAPTTDIEPFSLLSGDTFVDDEVTMAASQCNVQRKRILDLYPCTALQEGLMMLSIAKVGAYVYQTSFRVPRMLDIHRLKRAWDIVVSANPILRTRIVKSETGGCLQAVIDDSVTWLFHDCPIEQYLKDDLCVPVTWGASLHRFAVLTVPDSAHMYLIWTAHHALFDGWSQSLILEQLEQAYNEEVLTKLVPFKQYVANITNTDDAACAAFWSAELDGDTAASLPQIPSNTYTPRAEGLHERVIVVARGAASRITTSTTLRAAWALVIGRYAEAEDVVFGASLSGRNAPIQDIDKESPISGFLEGIQEQAADMMAFEHWGIQNIAQVSKNAAFQNLLTIHPLRNSTTSTPLGLEIVSNRAHADYHIYPLIVECFLTDDSRRIGLKMEYDTHVVPYAPQLASSFELVIQQLILHTHDDSPLRTLDFCSPQDKALILNWNQESPRIVEDCIHELISKNAGSKPEAAAICSWDFNLTYADLDLMSSKLARHLAYLGVKSEMIVPAVFEKSAWAIVAQLAVLKAGGVMCMLDPSHPLQRLEYNIDTTDADLILASESYSTLLQREGRTVLTVGTRTMQSVTDACCVSALLTVHPKNAAYVVFTSGTTGKPKGSITEHRAFVSSSASFAAAMQITESSRVLQHAAFSFDPYILETFTTLIQGGCVCVAKDEARRDPVELAEAMHAMGVTWTMMTPSAARLLARDAIPTLNTICLMGEAMSQIDRSWSNTVRLMNVYGPSECSVVSALNDNVTLESDNKSIGRGVGSRCWIVESHDHNMLAPVGCVGELLLESPGLARGYLKEPEKTKEAFISSPAWLQGMRPDSKVYKTGDLVQYSPGTGLISFIGRKDLQVKLHGQRLELGEIEHHLLADDKVRMAAVTLPKAGHFKEKLVATLSFGFMATTTADDPIINLKLVDHSDKRTAVSQLNDVLTRLESRLPSYMVPSVWAAVYRIPLTASFKVNKRAITTWLETLNDGVAREVMELTHDGDPSLEAVTAIERQLRDIIASVLGLSVGRVFLNRSFIGLGGDSITAIRLMARCHAENIVVKIKDILQSRTIVQLAELATVVTNSVLQKQDIVIRTGHKSVGVNFGLSPIQNLYVFNSGLGRTHVQSSLTASSHFNLSVLLRLKRDTTAGQLGKAIKSVVYQHPMLRARFAYHEPINYWSQSIQPMTEETYRFEQHTVESQNDMDSIIAASQRCLDPFNSPVFSVTLFEIRRSATPGGKQHKHILFMVAHHLVIDLVSWRIIIHDLEEALTTGKRLLKSSFSFQNWVDIQEQHKAKNLQQCEKPPNLPTIACADHEYWGISHNANVFAETITTTFSLDTASTKALLGTCNQCFETRPADLFVAALLESFAGVFGDRDLPPIYCEGHGRECPWDSGVDLSGTVGWFTIIYPLHAQLDGANRSIVDAVRRVKDARTRMSESSWSYLASRFLTREESAASQDSRPMEILFNFMGRLLQPEREGTYLCPVTSPDVPGSPNHFNHDGTIPATACVGPQCRRLALFEINVHIDSDDRANIAFTFNQQSLHQAKIRLWILAYHQSLLRVVDQLTTMPLECTLSDFPLMPLTYEDLGRIKSELIPTLGLTGFHCIEDIYPCGPTQKGILLSQTRSTGTYHESFLYAISSRRPEPLSLERLKGAWRQVVARHMTLRTVLAHSPYFGEEGYCQIVLRSWEPRIQHLECTSDDAALEQMSKMKASLIDAGGKLLTEPAHSMLFCQTPSKIYMFLEISHALIDGESMLVLIRDIALAYDGSLASDRTKPPMYRGYIEHIRGLPMSDSVAYWMKYINSVQPCHMPALREHDAHDTHSAADVQSIPIDLHDLSEHILSFCRKLNLTSTTMFQVAWGLVLRAYTGMDDVCFGYLTSGRDSPVNDIESIIGVVCNTLILRMHLDCNKTGLEVLIQAQDDRLNSIPHQFVSQADIQHHFQQKTRATTLNGETKALFNSSVSFRQEWRSTETETHLGALEFELLGGSEDTEYDVTVGIWSAGPDSHFCGSFNYKTSHMTAVQARHIIRTFTKAVGCIIEMSARRLHEWVLVTEDDVANSTRFQSQESIETTPVHSGETVIDASVDEIIEIRVQKGPDRAAVCSWDGQLTYRELGDLSARLANHLTVHHGVGPEVLVPICMEKSLWFVVSVLGVLKAGGAFVPLDANQPARFQPIVEQTGARLVLTSATLKKAVSQIKGCSALVIDEKLVQQFPAGQSPGTRQQRDKANAAYIIFTSGSTGVPKGVVVEHRAWCFSAAAQIDACGLDENLRMLQFSSYGFDASVGDVLTTLMVGGCICIPSESERLNDIEGVISRVNANTMFMTPSLSRILKPENIPSIRTLILGGEPTPECEIRRWRDRLRLILIYGPTECSMETSVVVCFSADSIRPNDIGLPNNGCKYWVVSTTNHNVLVPPGAIGELLIEGMILARGYLHDSARTAAAFIENPAWTVVNANKVRRMYKTGDLVQLQPDGRYRYLGRKDRQVKIHGQRVELGEVEHHFRHALDGKYPVAAEVVEASNKAKLMAFVALGVEYDSTTVISRFMKKDQLQDAISATAPSYMVPSAIIPVRDIPLLPSGKVNRKQLRKLGHAILTGKAYPSPFTSLPIWDSENASARPGLTKIQRQMRKIWATILNRGEISIDLEASFLEQGGDSLLAIKLVSTCRAAGLVVSVADILRRHTFEAVCQVAREDHRDSEQDTRNPKLKKQESLCSLISLNSPQFIHAICSQVGTDATNVEDIVEATALQSTFIASGLRRARGNTNYFVFRFHSSIDEDRLGAACQTLVTKHSVLRTVFVPFKRRIFQVVLRSMVPRFQSYQCLESQQENSAVNLIEADQNEQVVIGQQILRFLFLRGEGQSILVMRISHAQYDGMSLRILIDDLEGLYQGKSIPDRPAFLDFVYAAFKRNNHGAEEYWRRLLSGSTMTTVIPHSSPRFRKTERKMVHREIAMPRQQQSRNITFATILNAGWALVLAELGGSTDVVFGNIITGRNMSLEDADIGKILGPCVNLIPVRVKLQTPGKPTETQNINDILRQIHDQQLAAIPFETFGMDKIVERCTDWPLWAGFGTIVLYQHLDGVEEVVQGLSLDFGDGVCSLTTVEGQYSHADIVVLVTPKSSNDNVDVALYYDAEGENRGLTRTFMAHVLDRLLDNIEMLSSVPGEQLLPKTIETPRISLMTQNPAKSQEEDIYRRAVAEVSGYSFEDMPSKVKDIVTNAWESILSPLPDQYIRESDQPPTGNIPFYDIWGSNLIAASQFAAFYAGHSVQVTAEEMIEHPSKLAQSILLAKRMHISLPASPLYVQLVLQLIVPLRLPWSMSNNGKGASSVELS